jgi:uncharacterized protein
MIPLIAQKKVELAAICRQYSVQRLELFGSAAKGSFKPSSSDLDFVVTFADKSLGTYADRYLGLAEALERLFSRKVDLMTERSIRNPYFRATVEASRQIVYELGSKEVLA